MRCGRLTKELQDQVRKIIKVHGEYGTIEDSSTNRITLVEGDEVIVDVSDKEWEQIKRSKAKQKSVFNKTMITMIK